MKKLYYYYDNLDRNTLYFLDSSDAKVDAFEEGEEVDVFLLSYSDRQTCCCRCQKGAKPFMDLDAKFLDEPLVFYERR